MKKLFLSILLVFFSNLAHGSVFIHSASNLDGDKFVVEVQASDRKLFMMNLMGEIFATIHWPSQLKSEEVMGLVLYPDKLVLIAQNTSMGSGLNPRILEYDLKLAKWESEQALKCVSFDSIVVQDETIVIECDADPLSHQPKQKVKVTTGSKTKLRKKIVFPVTSDVSKSGSFNLNGQIFQWTSVETHTKESKSKKTILATKLGKTK